MRRWDEWLELEQRDPNEPCLLDGERRFMRKLCRRCGYWRMFSREMTKYYYCEKADGPG